MSKKMIECLECHGRGWFVTSIGSINECAKCGTAGRIPDRRKPSEIEDALRAERDNFRAVLDGEGYQHLDKIAAETRDCTQIGAAAKARTLEIIAERDALRAEVREWEQKAANWMASPEAQKQLDGYRELTMKAMMAEDDAAALRAEVAKYRGMEVEDAALRNDNEALRAEVAALKAELAKRDEPLTDEQCQAVGRLMRVGNHENMRKWDAAIRRVRRGE